MRWWPWKRRKSVVMPDRPLNGLRPKLVIMDEAVHEFPPGLREGQREVNRRDGWAYVAIPESGADMERRAASLRESFALESRVLHHETRGHLAQIREAYVRKIMRQYHREHSYRVAFIYARLEKWGA